MIRRLYAALPGSPSLRVLTLLLGAAAALALLVLFYGWMGATFFDSGGAIG